jgi:hypothetical protein
MRPFRVGVLLCVCSTAVFAQDFPKAEIFGGYSYASMPLLSSRDNANGWNASATVNLFKWFGLTSDFNGLYGLKDSETIPRRFQKTFTASCSARRSLIGRADWCHLRTCWSANREWEKSWWSAAVALEGSLSADRSRTERPRQERLR